MWGKTKMGMGKGSNRTRETDMIMEECGKGTDEVRDITEGTNCIFPVPLQHLLTNILSLSFSLSFSAQLEDETAHDFIFGFSMSVSI